MLHENIANYIVKKIKDMPVQDKRDAIKEMPIKNNV